MYSGLKDYYNTIRDQPRTEKPIVYWIWGLTNTGKTHSAINLGETYYFKDDGKWWDNYNYEDVIIIDDFNLKDLWSFWDLMQLLGENKYQGEIKGGYININSKYIVIICEFPPDKIWPAGNKLDRVKRRIDYIVEKTSKDQILPGIITT